MLYNRRFCVTLDAFLYPRKLVFFGRVVVLAGCLSTERLFVDFLLSYFPESGWQASSNPVNTIFDVKRLIGRASSDATVKADVKLFPFTGDIARSSCYRLASCHHVITCKAMFLFLCFLLSPLSGFWYCFGVCLYSSRVLPVCTPTDTRCDNGRPLR